LSHHPQPAPLEESVHRPDRDYRTASRAATMIEPELRRPIDWWQASLLSGRSVRETGHFGTTLNRR
jgi:hypothetical protein